MTELDEALLVATAEREKGNAAAADMLETLVVLVRQRQRENTTLLDLAEAREYARAWGR